MVSSKDICCYLCWVFWFGWFLVIFFEDGDFGKLKGYFLDRFVLGLIFYVFWLEGSARFVEWLFAVVIVGR